ncbi:hypothetical protein AAFN86_16700 [Roseomonas sp. CAU 1739]
MADAGFGLVSEMEFRPGTGFDRRRLGPRPSVKAKSIEAIGAAKKIIADAFGTNLPVRRFNKGNNWRLAGHDDEFSWRAG